jgi:hypothetical protein
VVFDLSKDPAPYLKMSAEELKDLLLQPEEKRPFVLVRKELTPILMPIDQSEAVLPKDYDEKTYAARAKAVQADADFIARVEKAAVLARQSKDKPATPNPLPETLIRQKMSATARKNIDQWMEEFNTTPDWSSAAKLVKDFPERFKTELAIDPSLSRFAEFAADIVFEHAPEELGAAKAQALRKSIASRLMNPDPKAPYMTIPKARGELEAIERDRAKGDKHWAHVTDTQIRSLKLYYTALEKECAAFVSLPPATNDNAAAKPPAAKKQFNGGSGPKV